MKECTQWKKPKDIESFYKRTNGDSYNICKECMKLNAKSKYKKSKLVAKPVEEMIKPLDRQALRAGFMAGLANIRC